MPLADDAPAAAKSGPVTLRLGDLEPEVQRRRRKGESPASVVRRDLERYYRLLRDAERWEPAVVTPPEVDALAVAAPALSLDAGSYRYVWAGVEETLDGVARTFGQDENPPISNTLDRAALIDRLKMLSLAGRLALLDRLEVYARLCRERPGFPFKVYDDALVEARLIDKDRLAWWRDQQRQAREHRGRDAGVGAESAREAAHG